MGVSDAVAGIRRPRGLSPLAVITLVMAALALAPAVVSDYYAFDILARAMILALLAIALDLAWGYGGILSLGHAAFFGLGAYGMSTVLLRWDSPLAGAVGLGVAVLIPVMLGLLVGGAVFFGTTSILFVAIVTLALPVLLSALALRVPDLTGGLTGLSGFPGFPWSGLLTTYYVILAVLCVVTALAVLLVRSDLGRLLVAVRDNEQRARFLGYHTARVKLGVFALSAGIAGFAGGLYAPYNGFVSHDLIGLPLSTAAIAWVAIGGRGTVAGALLGAAGINVLEPVLNEAFPGYWQLLLGLVFIVVVLTFPSGLMGLLAYRRKDARAIEIAVSAVAGRQTRAREVAIRALTLSFGSLEVLRGVDLTIRSGVLHGMIGPNGAGKSTLVNAVTGLLAPTGGEILVNGNPVARTAPASLVQLGVMRTFQASNVFETLRVGDNLFLAAGAGRLPSLTRYTPRITLPRHAAELLELSGLQAKLQERAGDLGHGDRKWLELCMVLAADPDVVFLDEPTAGLTAADRARAAPLLVSLAGEHGLGLLLIEHDLEFVKAIAQRLTVLADGRVLADGTVAEVLANPQVQQVYVGTLPVSEPEAET